MLVLFYLTKFADNSYSCGTKVLNTTKGVIISPDYSITNHSEVYCQWIIHSNRDIPLYLRINYLDIASCNDCCDSNYLKISNENRELSRYCSSKEAQDMVLKENLIVLDFHAKDYAPENRGIKLEYDTEFRQCDDGQFKCVGEEKCISREKICDTTFDCEDHSDEVNCTYCPLLGQAPCDYTTSFCFYPISQRCDGVVDCPGTEDEVNCFPICRGKLRCGNSPNCYDAKQHCDGNFDCINDYDERNCSHFNCGAPFNIKLHFICRNGRCIDRSYLNDGLNDCGDGSDEFAGRRTNYTVLAIFVGIFMSTIFVFLVCRWFMSRRNLNYLMANPPEFPRRHRNSFNIYNENDFRRGGVIFEAYLQSRREREERSRKRSANTKSKMDTIRRNLNRPQSVVTAREISSSAELKRNVENQTHLEKLVFENLSQKKDLSDSSDISPPSGEDLSLMDFSPKTLMEAHEEKCLLCRKNTDSKFINTTSPKKTKSSTYLMDNVTRIVVKPCKCKSDSNITDISHFDELKKSDACTNIEKV